MTELPGSRVSAGLQAEARGLVTFLLMLTGSRDLAEELFQETCLQVWRQRGRYDSRRDFGTWVRGIARRVVWRHWRTTRRDRSTPLTPEVLEALEASCAERERSGMAEDRRLALQGCLGTLREEQRHVLRLFYDRRWDLGRIAVEIGRSADAVKMLVSRLRRRLRECVSQRLAREQRHG